MTKKLIIGIDASNLRGGGGLTHLSALLAASEPERDGLKRIIVWGGESSLKGLPQDRQWIDLRHCKALDGRLLNRAWWTRTRLPQMVDAECGMLLLPGGLQAYCRAPWITMCRNMLPFEHIERKRYPIGFPRIRLELLNWAQKRSFERAAGVIFLTRYAQEKVCSQLRHSPKRMSIIPHGVDRRFLMPPRHQASPEDRSWNNPFNLLYVSTINEYKHQWCVAEAVWMLRNEGFPLRLDLIGGSHALSLNRLNQTIERLDPKGEWVTYHGPVPFNVLHNHYHEADVFIFASSCENMPNILLEAMASGLPIVCSDRGPMPEILGSAGVYFNPENPESMAKALKELLAGVQLRQKMAKEAYEKACKYSWDECAAETFGFLHEVYENSMS